MYKVTILFPRTGEIPIGGFKVAYEYGNRLVNSGIEVNYVYGIAVRKDIGGILGLSYRFIRFFRYLKYKYFIDYTPKLWFKTNRKAKHLLRYDLSEKYIPDSDIVIATAWITAFWLDDYKKLPIERKFYFIQHFEDWHGSTDKVIQTWKMNLQKIVIAPWLQDIGNELGVKTELVENGFDANEFFLTLPIAEKEKHTAIMLWHDNPFKGCLIGLKAFELVKKIIPDFKAILFGVPNPPTDLPDWIEYHQQPNKDEHRILYNRASVFVGTSYTEGWGLTLGEAMLCGCAAVCTDNKGYTILAKDEDTALLSGVGEAEALADNIIRLMTDDSLRCKLANNGMKAAGKYTWEKSFEKFKSLIQFNSGR